MIFSIIIFLIIILYHVFSNIEIKLTPILNIEDGLEFEMKLINKSIFCVTMEDVKLEIDTFHLGKPQLILKKSSEIRRIKPTTIKRNSSEHFKFFYRIIEEFNEPFRGDLLIIMKKFGIKIPFEQKLGENE